MVVSTLRQEILIYVNERSKKLADWEKPAERQRSALDFSGIKNEKDDY